LKEPSWNNTTVLGGGDLAGEVAKLKDSTDGEIYVHGSAQLVQGLLAEGLLDELRLMVFPVLLGSGKRLFGASSRKQALKLASRKTVGDGIAVLIYEVAR
jgi:dihydrofolate reductase